MSELLTAKRLAYRIVDPFSWSTNVSVNGRLVGQQYTVAEKIEEAITADRELIAAKIENFRRDLYGLRRRSDSLRRQTQLDTLAQNIADFINLLKAG